MATTTIFPPRWPRTPLAAAWDVLLARLGDRLHRDGDRAALAAGLQVIRLPYGGRQYRDPAMDALREDRP